MEATTKATRDVLTVDEPDIERDTAFSRRLRRAFREDMEVTAQITGHGIATGIYDVFSESGRQYTVDMKGVGRCDCRDDAEGPCKHSLRVLLEIRNTAIPAPGEGVDDDYRNHLTDRHRLLRVRLENRREKGWPTGSLPERADGVAAALARIEATTE